MRPGIAEADWKVLRALHPVALDRYCERVLQEVQQIATDTGRSQHQRYLDIYRLIQDRDRTLAYAFNDMRRSVAWLRIAEIWRLNLLTDAEFARFSEKTRVSVRDWFNKYMPPEVR